MSDKKLCPLIMAGTFAIPNPGMTGKEVVEMMECKEDKCQWWVDDDCIIVRLYKSAMYVLKGELET